MRLDSLEPDDLFDQTGNLYLWVSARDNGLRGLIKAFDLKMHELVYLYKSERVRHIGNAEDGITKPEMMDLGDCEPGDVVKVDGEKALLMATNVRDFGPHLLLQNGKIDWEYISDKTQVERLGHISEIRCSKEERT